MKNKVFKALCAISVTVMAAPAFTHAEAPVIHGNIIGPAAWVDYTSGIYSFKAESPVSLTLEKESRFIGVNGGGDCLNGLYYYVSNNDGLGELFNYRMYVYDADTWIPKNNFRVPGNDHSLDFSLDPATGRFYGSFTTDDEQYQFGWMNPADAVFNPIIATDGGYPVVAVNRYGAVYAIDSRGDVLSINTLDGKATKVLSTNLAPAGMQTGCFDPCGSADVLYWCYRNSEDQTYLYSIDLSKGAPSGVTLLGAFPQQEVVTGAYIRPAADAFANAPSVVESLTATPAGKQTKVSFTLPSATAGGASLEGKSLSYVLVTDGVMPASVATARAGQTVTLNLDLPQGEHTVAVTVADGEQIGQPQALTVYVGSDTPKPVADIKTSRNGNDFVATWTAPAEGANGGSINTDALTYEVKFYNGVSYEVTSVTECAFTKTFVSAKPVNCFIEVTAVDGNLKSEVAVSDPVMMGDGYALPFSTDFKSSDSAADFMAWDANGDGVTWIYESIFEDMRTNYKYTDGDMDDWVFTPILALDTDNFYHVRFDAKTAGLAYEELMEVCAGLQRLPGDMTLNIMPVTTFCGTENKTYDAYFSVEQAGNWSVGFHSVTRGNNFYIAIDNLTIECGGKASAPAAAQLLVAHPYATGELKCDIDVTAPSVSVNGTPLTGNLSSALLRSGRQVMEINGIAPGAEFKFEGVAGAQGNNIFQVVFKNADGSGMPAQVEAYMGVDVPGAPENVNVVINNKGLPEISWDAPKTGANGGVINAAGLIYTVRRAYDYQVLLKDSPNCSVVDNLGLEYTDQAIMYYEVYATSAAGTGAPATSPHFIMGTPYLMPFYDSFKEAIEMQGPWLGLLLDNPEGAWYLDEEGMRPSAEAVDGDGGVLTFAPSEAGHTSAVSTPLVNIDKSEYPTLQVFVFCSSDDNSRLDISVRTARSEAKKVQTVELDDSDMAFGWNLLQIPLVDFKGEDYVQVIFTGTAGDSYNNHITLDRIGIFDIPQYDVEATLLSTPDEMIVGKEHSFHATVSNVGVDAVDNIEVTLMREDTPVASCKIESIAPGMSHTVGLKDKADLSFDELTYYSFSVKAAKDKNSDNDISVYQEVPVALPHYPVPQLSGEVTGDKAQLVWTAPDCKGVRAPVTDGFESYTPFIIDNVGDWTMVDVDGNPGTTGILDGDGNELVYDNAGAKMAYQVFNPGLVGFPIYDEIGQRSMYAAHRGEQMLCAFCDLDGYNNDWLISPVLPGDAQTVSFYAKSYSSYYGLEAFIIMINKGESTDVKDFTELTQVVNAPADWTRFYVDLPAGTRRFAIRCISIDQFAFCVDDVKYIPASSKAEDLELTGYNIYRDNQLAASLPASATSWNCPITEADGNVQFRVSAVYAQGESTHSNAIVMALGIENVATSDANIKVKAINGGITVSQPDDCEAVIYTIDGLNVATVKGSGTVSLPASIYVVKTLNGATKIAVR